MELRHDRGAGLVAVQEKNYNKFRLNALGVVGGSMKPTALHLAIFVRIISGMFLVSALATAPAFAQHGGAGAHAGVGRAGSVRAPHAPVIRSPGPAVINRPMVVNPVTRFRIFPPSRPPRRFPIAPIIGWPGFGGFGYGAFWFPNCNVFPGWGYGCSTLSPYYGYAPEAAYPPFQPSTSLEYSPLPNMFPPEDNLPESGGQLRQQILLYLNDGSVFAVASYTVSDGKLHYVTTYGGQNDIDLDLLDLQKTIDANAARGVTFTLMPPSPAPASPRPISPPSQ